MDLKILPNEVYVTEFGALIRTRCPKDQVTDQMIHSRVLAANLAAGDVVRVQCMDHGYNTVLHFTEYLVYSRSSELKRIEVNDRDIRQVDNISFSVFRTLGWTATPAAPEKEKPQKEAASSRVKWNPGKKKFEVIVDGSVVYEDADKGKASEFLEKAA